MKWFRSLFWKIFLAVWSSTLLVLVMALVLVSQMNERDRLNDWLLDSVRLNAEQLVEEYERNDGLSKRSQRYYSYRFARGFFKRLERGRHDWDDRDHDDRRRDDHRRDDRHHDRKRSLPPEMKADLMPRIRVYDIDRDRRIFGRRPRPESEQTPHHLSITSESGRAYRVEVALKERRSPFGHLMKFFLSYQIAVILLGSALASILLSWLIIRPLNRLRDHTRDLHQGDLASRAGQQLSRRRDELGELAREFNSMADYVEQTLVGGQRLLQDVSHELRAPLARLQVAAGLAEQKLGEGDRLAGRINQECDQLNRLIDEILSLSRLDAQPLDNEPFELAQLLRELYDDIRFSAPERVLEWPDEGPLLELPGNRALLHRALNNVLTNALRHTPTEATICVTVSRDAQQLTLVIRDTGPGVDEALLPTLLEPFVRAEENKADGYGLGLSIARRAVERLKGRISLRNHPEGGLEVTLQLPL